MATHSYRGVPYRFVGTKRKLLEELKCPICLELVSDPVQTSCGHLFCGECIRGIRQCPVDRQLFNTTPDQFNNRRLRGFRVKCPNFEKGCSWQGDLGDAENHTRDVCQFTIVACHNGGCNEKMGRQELDKHMYNQCPQRRYQCPHCRKEDTYLEVTTTHFTMCEDMPLPCPSRCGRRRLVRRNMAQHLSTECPEELVACTYAIAGCQEFVKRKDLKQHLQDKDAHLDAVMSSYLSLSLFVRDIANVVNSGSQQKVEATRLPLAFRPWLQTTPTCYPQPPWVIRMEGFQEKKENDIQWYSDPVYSHFGGYKMCLNVDANGSGDGKGTHVSVFISLMRGDNDDNLKWPFKGTIKVSLLNQLEVGQHHTKQIWSPHNEVPEDTSGRVTWSRDGRGDHGWGLPHFISSQDLDYQRYKNQQFLKEDTLFFRVDCIEPKLKNMLSFKDLLESYTQ